MAPAACKSPARLPKCGLNGLSLCLSPHLSCLTKFLPIFPATCGLPRPHLLPLEQVSLFASQEALRSAPHQVPRLTQHGQYLPCLPSDDLGSEIAEVSGRGPLGAPMPQWTIFVPGPAASTIRRAMLQGQGQGLGLRCGKLRAGGCHFIRR